MSNPAGIKGLVRKFGDFAAVGIGLDTGVRHPDELRGNSNGRIRN